MKELIDDRSLYQQIASLLLYQSVFQAETGKLFIDLLKILSSVAQNYDREVCLRHLTSECLQIYSLWFKSLANQNCSWQDYLVDRILLDDNPFSDRVQKKPLAELPDSLILAAKHDLTILQNIYHYTVETISQQVKILTQIPELPIAWDLENTANNFLHRRQNWADSLHDLADYYRQYGTGIFATYKALKWQDSHFQGIANPDPIRLREIIGYEEQKETLLKNTEFLLAGYPALHVLLYGSRGSGKSSLVKALLPEYQHRKLRLIEVDKTQLKDLPIIVEKLRNLPQKFIIFVDDLSFEEDNDAFKSLKVVLEGSLTARAQNVVVYATSNRRHLIREFFGDRPHPSDGDEVHAWDTVQEKLSFSDRFGLTLTFEPANQETYLNIVRHLARQADITLSQEELEFRAKQWATRHNGRSGRTARQFIDFLRGELSWNNNKTTIF